MAFRASNSLAPHALDEAKSVMLRIKTRCIEAVSAWSAGASATELMQVLPVLASNKVRLQSLAATPGIAAYAASEENDATYDVVAEFTNVVSLLTGAISALSAAIPKDANGYVLMYTIGADGHLAPRSFTAAQVSASGVPAALQAVADAIV